MFLERTGLCSRSVFRTAALTVGLFALPALLGPAPRLAPRLILASVPSRIAASATFSTTSVTTGTQPLGIAAGDFDCDGKPDLVASISSVANVSVFQNTSAPGALAFSNAENFSTETSPRQLAVGDLDGDGKNDIATANTIGASVSVLRNTSTENTLSFAHTAVSTGGQQTTDVALADLDGDGKLDLIVNRTGSADVVVLRNTGGPGALSFAGFVPVGDKGDHLELADVDGDGKPDLAQTDTAADIVRVYRNTSTSGAVSFASNVNFATGDGPAGIHIADLDGDSKAEIVVSNSIGGNLSVFRNTSTNGTISLATRVDFAAGNQASDVIAVDLDDDDKRDLVAINSGANTVSTLRNTSITGTISFATKEDQATGASPIDLVASDLDGDGKPDLAITNHDASTISLLRNTTTFAATSTDYFVNATTGSNTTGTGTQASPWKTITYALNQITGTGKTLHVAAGTYDTTLGETFPINVKNGVSLVGAGIDASILDAKGSAAVVRAASITDGHTRVEGFTIKGGGGTAGVGVSISGGSILRVVNNKITANSNGSSFGVGGGVYIDSSSPTITDNTISANSPGTFGDGGGIYITNGSPTIEGNTIASNTAYGAGLHVTGSTSAPLIRNNTIAENAEGGIALYSSAKGTIVNNTIVDNVFSSSSGPFGGIYLSSAQPTAIVNNIIAFNEQHGIYESNTSSDPVRVAYNLFYANRSGLYRNEGTTSYYLASSLNAAVAECQNNVDGDPLFTDRTNGNYHVRLGSPAIDAGDTTSIPSDEPCPNGGRTNIGAYGGTDEATTSSPSGLPNLIDYYVATTGSNTTGDGTSTNPWKTITYALGQITGSGRTLHVAAGTYDTTLGEVFPIYVKRGVSIVGAGIDSSIVDAKGSGGVFRAVSVVEPTTSVEGFTIKGGGGAFGVGLFISGGSALRIANNKITANSNGASFGTGGGLYIEDSAPLVTGNTISGNSPGTAGDGGGIFISNGSPTIEKSRILSNGSYGAGIHITGSASVPIIRNNVIARNPEGGIALYISAKGQIVNNTISQNGFSSSSGPFGGIYISSAQPDLIANNVIAFNAQHGIYESSSSSDPTSVRYNLFYANQSGLYRNEGTTSYYTTASLNGAVAESQNNIDGDPLFTARASDDYHERLGSSAIDAGDPASAFASEPSPNGSRINIGAYGNTAEATTSDPSGLPNLTDYYVATTGSNTTGDGTQANPWKTVTHALDQILGTGKTVHVAAGTYDTTLGEIFPIYVKSGVSLIGAGADLSILDAKGTGSVLRAPSIANATTSVEGFTIKGGGGAGGAGIFISGGSTLEIANNKITANSNGSSFGTGGGLYIEDSSPLISENTISANSPGTAGDGAGIFVSNGSPTIERNRIIGNGSYGAGIHVTGSSSTPIIRQNVITKNAEGGIAFYSSAKGQVVNNTIVENNFTSSSGPLGGIYISGAQPDAIVNNIIALDDNHGIYESGTTSDPGSVRYNLFYSNTSGLYRDEGSTSYSTAATLNGTVAECQNNLDGDPLFVDLTTEDYRLRSGSPAVDAGDPASATDPDGTRVDIGAHYLLTITSLTPNAGPTAGGTSVAIAGAGFTSGSSATFGGVAATSLTFNSSTSLTATAPAHAAGAVDVVVTTSGGSTTLAGGFTYVAPPTITSVTPSTGPTVGGQSVTIAGTNLANPTAVTFGGTAATVTASSATSITVTTPARAAEAVNVVVTTAGGTATATNAYTYAVAPTVTNVNPNTGPASGGTSVTITGTGFASGATVHFGSQLATSVNVQNATTITAVTPSCAVPAAPTLSSPADGATNVFVSTTLSWSAVTDATSYDIYFGTSSSPPLFQNTASTSVAVASLTTSTVYYWRVVAKSACGSGPSSATRSFTTSSSSTVPTPIVCGQTMNGDLSTSDGFSTSRPSSRADNYSFTATAGQAVTIALDASFDSYLYLKNPSGTVVASDDDSGPGTSSLISNYVPTVSGTFVIEATSFSGGVTGAYSVTLTCASGKGSASSRRHGASREEAAPIRAASHTPGVVDVKVTNPNALFGALADGFTYTFGPEVASVTPCSGEPGGGTSVTIAGVNLAGATSVTFGGTAATITANTATSITVTAPAHAAGAVDVVVTTPNGSKSVSGAYKYFTSFAAGAWTQQGIGTAGTRADHLEGTMHAMVVDPVTPATGYACSTWASGSGEGSFWKTTDGGQNWVLRLEGSNLCRSLAIDSSNPTTLYVGSYFGIRKSTDGGNAWSSSGQTGPALNTAIAVDPTNSNNVYAGIDAGWGIYKSSNAAATFAQVLTDQDVRAIAVDPLNPQVLYAGTENYFSTLGGIFRSANQGTNWTRVLTNDRVNAIAIDPSATNVVYAATETGGVLKSQDSGTTWSAINSGLTTLSVRALAIHPSTPNLLYAATAGGGVFRSTDCGSSWSAINSGLTSLSLLSLAADPSNPQVVYGGTDGASIFKLAPAGTAPSIASVSPSSGPVAGGQSVTINGTNLTGSTTVTFGGTAATITGNTSTTITVTTPAHAAGAVDVVVTTPNGSATATAGYTYVSAPTISSLSPANGPTAGGQSVTVSGTNLTGATSVTFGGTSGTITSNTATSIVVTTPARATGAVNVVVTTAGGSATSTNGYTYVAAPTIGSVTPSSGPTAGGQSVTISGTNLSNATVTFGGTSGTITSNTATSIAVTTPAKAAGAVNVVVTTAGGSATSTNGYTYVAAPAITSITPATGSTAGGQSVTISGTNLANATSVTFGGTAATIGTNTATSITVTTPAHAAGAVNVVVTTAGGTATSTNGYTYGSAPAISSITPSSGPTAGGQSVTISGSNLSSATSVTFGGTSATITSNTATSIVVTTPAKAAGTVTVTVTTANGSANTSYTYVAAPTISSINPASGPTAGGQSVTISGTNLSNPTSVTFGGTSGTISSSSATSILVTTPAKTAGSVNVVVTTAGGTATTSYTYVAAPTITSITPTSGSASGGQSVTIGGTNLSSATSVTFGGTAATINSNTATSVVVTPPAHTAGAVNVVVTTAGGSATSTNGYTYLGVAPTISSVTPGSGPTTGGTAVVIKGTNFNTGVTVTFGGAAATGVSRPDSTTINATTPSHAAGAVNVVVTNTDSLSATLTNGFTYATPGSAPTVSSITPNAGSTLGGTAVAIAGTNFVGGATVLIGGTAATAVAVNSTTSISARTPPHAAGAATVVVTNPDNQSGALSNGYTYNCIDVTAPSLIAPANAATGVNTSPAISWSTVPGGYRYDLYLDTNAFPSTIVAADLAAAQDATSVQFTPANLLAGTKYFWKVVAKGDPICSGANTSSQTFTFTTSGGCSVPAQFDIASPANGATGVASSLQLSWLASTGANAYDLALSPSNPPAPFASTSGTSFSVSGLVAGTTYYWNVVAHAGCDPSKTTSTPVRSFTVAGVCAPAGAFNLIAPSNAATGISTTPTLSWQASTNAASYDLYFGTTSPPPLLLTSLPRTSVTLTGLEAGTTYFWSVLAKTPCNLNSVASAVQSFTTRTDCLPPGTPTITFSPPGNIGIRQTYVITWSEATGLSADGEYIIERSTSDAFTTILDSQRTRATFASFVAPAGGTYYHRVRAIPGCDPNKASLNSAVRSVVAVGGKPNVIFTVQPSPVITTLGDTLTNKKTSFALENLDDAPINVFITTQEPREFFSVVDPTDPTAYTVTLQPRAPKRFDVRFAGPPTNVADAYQGIIVVASTGTALNLTPYAFVNLKIGGADTATPTFRINGVQSEYAFFPPFGAGDDSTRPPLSIDIVNPGNTSMEIGAEIGPELWLSTDAGWNAAPILPGATLTVPLRTKRFLALNGSALPRYTYFTVRTKSGQSARLLVQDNDQTSVGTGRPSALEPGERSYIVPFVMTATSSNNRKLASRVKLSNVGGDSVQADLYYTPPDTDGFDPALVKKLTILVPPNDIVTLTDPLVQLFGLSAPARGQLEIRAPREKIGLLNVSSAVSSGSEGRGAFGFDVPTVLRGEGAKSGAPQVILGVTSTSDVVTDLILAETSGTDAATVRCVLFNQSGVQQGDLAVSVPRYGFHRIANVVSALGGSGDVEGGRIEIRVESGGGSVVGIAAFTDRLFDSAATIASRPFGNAAALQKKALARFKGMVPNAVTTVTMLVPVVVNGTLGSAANSYAYRTALQLTAPAGASASFTLTFRNALGGTPIIRNVTVPAGTTISYANVLEQLFNLLAGSNAQGQILIDTASGDVTARLSAYSPVTSTWTTVSNIEVVSPSSERFTGASATTQRPIYIDGLEQSTDATRGTRWMVLINEIDGQPVMARVRMYEAGNRSLPISDKEFSIAALSQFTLDTVFSAMDLNLAGDRLKDRTNVLCVVSASSGTGRISAVALGTDNVTGDTRVYTLTPNGGLPATGLLTVTPIRPLPGEILDPNPRVSSITPTFGPTAGGTPVTIGGADFKPGATVTIGGVAATGVSLASSTTINATTGAHPAGTVDVVVMNPDAKSGTLGNGFTYVDPTPTVTIEASDNTATEAGLTTGQFTVTRVGNTAASLTVNYAVTGTATSGSDFSALSGSVTIAAGASTATISVTPIDDSAAESNETVIVTIAANAAYVIGTPSSATVTITSDDVLPTVTIAASDNTATEAGTTTGMFTVTRTGATTAALTVNYAVSGTATSGSDFTALSGSVTIAAGSATATITVTPVNDTAVESDETVIATLSANAAYTVGSPSSATITITSDDAALSTVTIAATDNTATEAGPTTGTFTVTRTTPTTAALTVNYAVSGTATSGGDFTALSGNVTIAAGSATATITVTPINDTAVESDETVIATLSANAAYTIGTPSSATITITSDDTAPGRKKGDLNGNGNVTAFDASLVLQAVVGSLTLDPSQQCSADYNGNGQVTAFDAALVLQCVVGNAPCSTGTCP